MNVTFDQVLGTGISAAVVGFVVWLVTVPLRQRSVTGLIASVVLTGPLSVLGGIGWALLLGPTVHGPEAALVLALIAVVVAAAASGVFATRAHRRFSRSQRDLRASLAALTRGGAAGNGRPLLSELEAVRRDLTDMTSTLATQREQEHARDASFRELVGWVSSDLHAPLTVLRAMSEGRSGRESADLTAELHRLVAVVDDLADLVGTRNGVADVRSVVVPFGQPAVLADVLGDLVGALTPLLRLRGVAVTVTGDTRVRVGLVGPAGEDLGRHLLTVLVEAVRSAGPGTTIRVETSCRPDDEVVCVDVGTGSEVARDVRLPLLVAA